MKECQVDPWGYNRSSKYKETRLEKNLHNLPPDVNSITFLTTSQSRTRKVYKSSTKDMKKGVGCKRKPTPSCAEHVRRVALKHRWATIKLEVSPDSLRILRLGASRRTRSPADGHCNASITTIRFQAKAVEYVEHIANVFHY